MDQTDYGDAIERASRAHYETLQLPGTAGWVHLDDDAFKDRLRAKVAAAITAYEQAKIDADWQNSRSKAEAAE